MGLQPIRSLIATRAIFLNAFIACWKSPASRVSRVSPRRFLGFYLPREQRPRSTFCGFFGNPFFEAAGVIVFSRDGIWRGGLRDSAPGHDEVILFPELLPNLQGRPSGLDNVDELALLFIK